MTTTPTGERPALRADDVDTPLSDPGVAAVGRPAEHPPHADEEAFDPATLDPERLETKGIAGVISVLVVSAFVMILNETVLSVALPAVMTDFGIGATTGQWLTTGFMLTMAIVIPTTGFLIQRFTTKQLFVAALSLFLVGTALAAFAPNFAVIMLARIVQAGGTAIILPLLMTTTLTSVPPKHRGTIMGLNSIVISVGPAIGPTLSGIVVDALSWRWVFGLMLPIAAIALVLGIVLIRTGGEIRRLPLDIPSIIISVFAFGGIVYGLGSISALLEGAIAPAVAVVVGVAALALFVNRQTSLQQSDAALLDLRPFGSRNFTVSVAVVMLAMATMLGTVIVLPIYLQSALGISAMTAGLLMLPGGLIQGVVSPLAGRLYDKVGPRPVVVPGTVLLAAGEWGLTQVGVETGAAYVVSLYVVFGIGMALIMAPLMTVSLSSLPPQLYGHGSAIMNTLQQLGGAAGTALLVAAMTIGAAVSGLPGADGIAAGTGAAFVVGGILATLTIVLACFVHRLPVSEQEPRVTA